MENDALEGVLQMLSAYTSTSGCGLFAAALLGLFFLLRLPGLPPVPCLLTCCVLAVPVILLAFGTLSGLELTVIVGRLWRDLIYNANRRPFQRRD